MKKARSGSCGLILVGLIIAGLCAPQAARAVRIRDLAHFEGVRDNQLVGYGLVMGLDGTGDRRTTGFTLRSMSTLLESMGITLSPDEIAVRNVAAVMVTATLPPFARPGGRVDVTVASIGDASSLRGGILIQTPLEAADGKVYAVAQGPLLVGGYAAEGPGGASVRQNLVTVGRIPDGAIIERAVEYSLPSEGNIHLVLNRPDFTTVQRVAQAVNRITLGGAWALDAATVRIDLGMVQGLSAVELMAQIGELDVDPGTPARVVINERTGTIVAGGDVRLLPVAIAHGSLTIQVASETDVYMPEPFSPPGTTPVAAPRSDIIVSDQEGAFIATRGTSTLEELARALNLLGVTPRDVIAIFQALKEAGALEAELVIL